VQLKQLPPSAIPAALAKAERYRLLNEPHEAESICRDILEISPDNQEALVCLLLALTDQFGRRRKGGRSLHEAQHFLPSLAGDYAQAYYGGIIAERWAKAQLETESPRLRHLPLGPRGDDALRARRGARLAGERRPDPPVERLCAPPPGPPGAPAQTRARRRHRGRASPVTRELVRAIRMNPGDDRARRVYADWLLEQGDPRGEIMASQLAILASGKDAALTRETISAWTRTLPEWVLAREQLPVHLGFIPELAVADLDTFWNHFEELLTIGLPPRVSIRDLGSFYPTADGKQVVQRDVTDVENTDSGPVTYQSGTNVFTHWDVATRTIKQTWRRTFFSDDTANRTNVGYVSSFELAPDGTHFTVRYSKSPVEPEIFRLT
jgi:uncharacterized protein (TIGR02996 family)